MNIDNAIKILEDYRDGVEMEELREYPIVLSLGIEALKEVKEARETIPAWKWQPLPGETKE